MSKEKNIKEVKKKNPRITKKQLSDIEKEIKIKNELSNEEKNKVNKKVFENIIIADIVMVFLYFISLGALNIDTAVFLKDLKVFSIGILALTIMIFEYSYRKDNGNMAIHGIECLMLSIVMLFSIYIYQIWFQDFHMIMAAVSYIFAIYYTVKATILYQKMTRKYKNAKDDISEIIKK